MPDDEKDQTTGEDTQDDKGSEEFDADAHDLLLDDGEKGEEGEETSDDENADKDGEKGKDEPDELTKVKTELEKQAAHIKNLNKALHEARQERKGKGKEADKEGEAPLTKEQLRAIMKEHKDDPDVLLNVIEYAAQQAAKGAEKKAVDAVELSTKKKELDDYLSKNYPDLAEAESEGRVLIDKIKDQLTVGDHPYGDFLAVAVRTQLMLPSILQAAVEQGKKEAQGKNADDKRKDAIRGNALPKGKGTGGAGSGKATLSAESADVAGRLGLSPKGKSIYAQMLKGSKKPMSVED
jgi:hypothetical protein